MKNLVFFCFLINFFITKAQTADTLKFHQKKILYIITQFSSSGYNYKDPISGEAVYDYSIILPLKIGYIITPKMGTGLTGKYSFTNSTFKEVPDFYTYGVFLDYFPFKKKNFFLNTSLYNGNIFFASDTNIISSSPIWFYSSIGLGSHFKITRYLNFITELEYLIPLNKDQGRKPMSILLGLSILPQNFKKN
ncbi:MAG: hypothetical protein M3Q58_13080 [Bacteroidota bacterium]|nr:hypothetical protein [Bacteroidota bacterium]